MPSRAPDEFDRTLLAPEPGELLSRRYLLERELGRGGVGVVWLAKDLQLLDVLVAIKTLPTDTCADGQLADNLRRVAAETFKLTHRHIVRTYSLERDESRGGLSYLVMQYVDGRSLLEVLTDHPNGVLPGRAQIWATQLGEALSYAHEEGVRHFDIRPANVLIDSSDNAFLADFGIAHSLREAGAVQSHLPTVSSVTYMSPEIRFRSSSPNEQSDIYSLGAVLFHCLHGLDAAQDFDSDRGTGDEPIEQVITLAMSPDPTKRPADAIEFANSSGAGRAKQVTEEDGKDVEPVELPLVRGAAMASEIQSAAGQDLGLPVFWTNVLGIEFALIPPGAFFIGRESGAVNAAPDEMPRTLVPLASPFYLSTSPLTQAHIRIFCEAAASSDAKQEFNRLWRDRAFAPDCRRSPVADDVPATGISADDAMLLCVWLGELESHLYRLPTEAEWEYAARAGTECDYWWDELNRGSPSVRFGATEPGKINTLERNAWGLGDVVGNVAEWTSSQYGPYLERLFESGAPLRSAVARAIRGGSWRTKSLEELRISHRYSAASSARTNWIGVRLVRDITGVTQDRSSSGGHHE